MAKSKKIAGKSRTARAHVRGRSLDLPDRISLRDGNDVLVSASEPVVAPDPFVVWFLPDQDLPPADLDLAI